MLCFIWQPVARQALLAATALPERKALLRTYSANVPGAFIAVTSTSHLRTIYVTTPKGERFFNTRHCSSGKPFGTTLGLASVLLAMGAEEDVSALLLKI